MASSFCLVSGIARMFAIPEWTRSITALGVPAGATTPIQLVRPLAQTRIVVCASPEYWEREGKPDEPRALSDHHCIVILGGGGALLDHWTFEKNGERQTVDVRSNVLTHNQSWMYEAACAGAGVIRSTDFSIRRYQLSGLLVPVLADWEGLEAPTHFAVYRPSKRRSKLVRVFVDFLAEIFAEMERERLATSGRIPRVPRPDSFGRAHGRQSTYVSRRRKVTPNLRPGTSPSLT
jgi:LysR family transcriptional regulator, regulator for bpeEF and oprC